MESKTLGRLELDSERECRISKPIKVTVLGKRDCVFAFPELDDDSDSFPDPFDDAVQNFLTLPAGWLECCSQYLWEYYRDISDMISEVAEDNDFELLPADADILANVELDSEVEVTWDYDEHDVYISLSGSCDWEIEHGLQITICRGSQLAKVGEFDGHVTNADSFDREDFKDVIYVKRSML